MYIAQSVNEVPVRLTYERWFHIVENHDYLSSYFHDVLDTIEDPEYVVLGNGGTLKATRNMGRRKWLVVIYRELSKSDGFVITAYILGSKPKGVIIWERQ